LPHPKTVRIVFTDGRCYSLGVAGDIITRITDSGLGVSAMLKLTMDEADAEEFLQLYKGVVQEYPLMVTELCCGPCIAMEICGNDAQQAVRELAGPPDPVYDIHRPTCNA